MRNKNTVAMVEDLRKKTEEIMENFADFTVGTRVLLLLQRTKEGGHNDEHKRRRARIVTHNPKAFKEALFELLLLQELAVDNYRIYVSASPRDIKKAELEFKTTMLAVDFGSSENKQFFYEHIEDKWISALMASNPVKGEGLFILDIDDVALFDPALKWAQENGVEVVKQYPTKNGWHIVVKPFNRTLFPKELGEVKDDGLILLSY